MPRSKAQRGSAETKKIRRIKPPEAEIILDSCRRILAESSDRLEKLGSTGLGEFLSMLDEKVLQLAMQPDPWGERMKSTLISEMAPALCKASSENIDIEDLVKASNVVMLCLLLEIGRRRKFIQVEFQVNPSGPGPCVKLRVGPSNPLHSLNRDEMMRLSIAADLDIIGLCYFGDADSRAAVETALTFTGFPKSQICGTEN